VRSRSAAAETASDVGPGSSSWSGHGPQRLVGADQQRRERALVRVAGGEHQRRHPTGQAALRHLHLVVARHRGGGAAPGRGDGDRVAVVGADPQQRGALDPGDGALRRRDLGGGWW
jgi:hypothetical protein